MTALMVCMRFSAWSKAMQAGDSNTAQRAIRNFFNRVIQCGGGDGCQHHRDQQQHPARCVGHERLQKANNRPAAQGTNHQHLAVREVDEIDDAVDHGVTQSHQCVHAAEHQAVDDLLKQDVHLLFTCLFVFVAQVAQFVSDFDL